MYLGDNVIADGITTLVDDYRKLGCNSQILLARVPNPSQFGVAELENGRVVRLTEKPKATQVRPGPRRRLHVRRHDLRGRPRDPAERPAGARDHRRDPVAGGPRQERASAPRDGLVEGHREDRRHARGQPDHPRHVHGPRDRERGRRMPGRGQSRDRARSPALELHGPRARRSSAPAPRSATPSSAPTRRSARAASSTGARSRTRSSSRARAWRGSRCASRIR